MFGLRKRTPFLGDYQKRWTCRDCGQPEVVYMRRPSVDRPACCQHCGSENLALVVGRPVYRSFASQRPLRWETLREVSEPDHPSLRAALADLVSYVDDHLDDTPSGDPKCQECNLYAQAGHQCPYHRAKALITTTPRRAKP